MPTDVFPLVASWPQTQDLMLETHIADFGDGFEQRVNFSPPYSHADGTGGVSSYPGRNSFSVKLTVMDFAINAAALWAFYKAHTGSLDPFYFYNVPDERASIDLTGADTTGRYLVRFQDAKLTREKFTLQLYSASLALIEVRA